MQHLGKSNQQRLYASVVKSVVSEVKEALSAASSEAELKIGYDRVCIPADGRCGFRAILASQDMEAFRRVPRTLQFLSIYKYIYIYSISCVCVHI